MDRLLIAALYALLTFAAAAAPPPAVMPATPPKPVTAPKPPSSDAAAETPTAAPTESVPSVDIETLKDDTKCRRERPTGSRIAVERCYSTKHPPNDARDDMLRRDVEEMRARQNAQQTLPAARRR